MSENLSPPQEVNSVSFDDLPKELFIGILSRLPIKTIVQSTCVCKRWRSIIKSQAFISAHSISNPSNHYILLAASSTSTPPTDPKLYLLSDEKFLSHHSNLRIPFETRSASLFIVGSCNGLVCLTDDHSDCHGHDIYLFNPSIQMHKKLSVESSCYADLIDVEVRLAYIVIGFGYSEVENDYKVVRIMFHVSSAWTKAEVYSLRTGKWKIIDAPVDPIPTMVSAALVDGCLYWLPNFAREPYYLQCFDMKHEVFNKIELPAGHNELLRRASTHVFQKNGSLALFMKVRGNSKTYLFMMGKDSSGQVQWEEFNYEIEYPDVLPWAVGCSSNGNFISWENIPLMISAINFDDLSSAQKLRLDPDNDSFSVVDKFPEDDVVIDYNTDDDDATCGYSHELSVDTDFVESLVLFLD